jgi:Ca2+-binding RTX toxin-like protein
LAQFTNVTFTGKYTASGSGPGLTATSTGILTAVLSEDAAGNVTGTWSYNGSALATGGGASGTFDVYDTGLVSGTAAAVIFESVHGAFVNGHGAIAVGDASISFAADFVFDGGSGTASGSFAKAGTPGAGNALTLTGGAGNDNLSGGAGADTFDGGAGNDLLRGLAGNDQFTGGSGNDTFEGGAGNDLLALGSRAFADLGRVTGFSVSRPDAATLRITDNVTHQTYTIRGAWGANPATGDQGIESFQFSDQTVTLADLIANSASALVDTFTGSASADQFDGLAGNDIISGGAGDDVLAGGAGNDTIDGGTGDDSLDGGAGSDVYVVDSALDVVSEKDAAGKDTGGLDTLRTSLASYTLGDNVENLTYTGSSAFSGIGNKLANVITGGAGNDSLDGGLGADKLIGGAGDDTYFVDNAADKVIETVAAGGAGSDTVRTTLAVYSLAAAPDVENLAYAGAAGFNATGNAAGNQITGGSGNDKLCGLAGDDTLDGGAGNDRLDGGLGTDTARMSGSLADYQIALKAGNLLTLTAGGATDTLLGIEKVVFDNGTTDTADDTTFDVNEQSAGLLYNRPTYSNNTLTGTAQGDSIDGIDGNDAVSGLAGNDTLAGGVGNDTLTGGAGNDTLAGGAGRDSYVFDTTPGADNADVILDFAAGDKLVFSHGVFAELAVGAVTADAIYLGTAAHDASDRLVYDKATGHLYYDADGNGAGEALLVATLGLTVHPALTAASFGVIA